MDKEKRKEKFQEKYQKKLQKHEQGLGLHGVHDSVTGMEMAAAL